MSHNPVYGHCKAGCKIEVVSKEEFEETKIRIVDKNGNPVKELVLEVDEETAEMNIKFTIANTETPTE
jgi:uncharacterized membrane protein